MTRTARVYVAAKAPTKQPTKAPTTKARHNAIAMDAQDLVFACAPPPRLVAISWHCSESCLAAAKASVNRY